MNEAELNNIKVDVETRYIEDQSNPEQNYYVFAYTITIKNKVTQNAERNRITEVLWTLNPA